VKDEMDELRHTLNYLYCGCEIDPENKDSVERSLDTLDWIMNIIESTNIHNAVECVDSISKIRNMTCVEDTNDDEDSF